VRIGVLGGSFDPVHLAHLTVAEAAAAGLGLAQVRFVPAAEQPFKPEGPHAAAQHRVAMLELALADRAEFVLDLREIERGGISHTVETLASLRHDFPGDELFLLVGADAALELPRWRDSSRIGEMAQVVAMSRAGAVAPAAPYIAQSITVPSLDISSSAARQAVREGTSLGHLVPESVAEYIRTHELYYGGD
jgi:nicotinate-nucleotide adenylyltransferase